MSVTQREKWKAALRRRTQTPRAVSFIDPRSESSYEFRPDLRATIEIAPDGKRFVVEFRDGRLTRTSELQELAPPVRVVRVNPETQALSQRAISEILKHGKFVMPGLGQLVRVERKARILRNSVTGENQKIPASNVLRFEVEKTMKDALLSSSVPSKRRKR